MGQHVPNFLPYSLLELLFETVFTALDYNGEVAGDSSPVVDNLSFLYLCMGGLLGLYIETKVSTVGVGLVETRRAAPKNWSS